MGVVSYGSECPSHGVYARVTKVKHWIQFIAQGAEDTNCNQEIPHRPGNIGRNNQNVNQLLFPGLMITGGSSDVGDGPLTAEVWLPGNRSCQLPMLPSPGRRAHTQSSYTACGGPVNNCLTFNGEWE